jgi:hypothetical protein
MATIKKIRTPQQLRAIARSQTNAEISSQVSPWAIQRNQLKTRRQRALDDMNTLFKGLGTYEQQNLGVMGEANQQGAELQNQAFQQAQSRMDQFRQQRAAEAQALAQSTGGPVPISAFTDQIDPGGIQQSAASGALIGAIGAGQDQFAEIGRFSNEVFPLIQAEENKSVRQNFEDSINAVQSEIANLKGQRGGLANKRYNELLAQERDYQIAGGTLGLNKRQLALQRQSTINPKTGKPYSHEEQMAALRQQKSQQLWERTQAKTSAAQTEAHTQMRTNSYALLQSLKQGQPGTPYKATRYVQVGYMDPVTASNKGYILDPAGRDTKKDKQGLRMYYKPVTEQGTLDSGVTPISPDAIDPTTGMAMGDKAYEILYQKLIAYGTPPKMARNIIANDFGLEEGWMPGNYKPPKNPKPGAYKIGEVVVKGAKNVGRGVGKGLSGRPPKPKKGRKGARK